MKNLLLFIFVCFSCGVSAQTSAVPDTICTNNTLNISDIGSDFYDFCSSKKKNSITSFGGDNITGASLSLGGKLVEENGIYYYFALSRDKNAMYRVTYGDGLANPASNVTQLSGLGGLFNITDKLDVIKANGVWYAFVTNLDNNSQISKVTIGTDITNNNVSGINIGSVCQSPRGLQVIKEQNSYYLLVTSSINNQIYSVNLGTSLASSPNPLVATSTSSVFPGAEELFSIKFVKNCGIWQGLAITTGGKLYAVKYTSGLQNSPTITELSNSSFIAGQVFLGIGLEYDNGVYLVSVGTVSPVLYTFVIDANLSVISDARVTALSGMSSLIAFDYVRQQSNRYLLALDFSACRINKFRFNIPCSATSTISGNSLAFNYSEPGKYYITKNSLDNQGCIGSVIDSVVVVNALSSWRYTYDCSVKQISLDATNSCAFAPPITYTWNLGDGSPEKTGMLITHQYQEDGIYNAKLTIADAAGNTAYRTQKIVAQRYKPAINFTMPAQLCSGTEIQFTDISVSPFDTIKTWSWTFGNNQTSSLRHPKTIYNTPGTYTVTLKVTTRNGCDTTTSKTFNVDLGPAVKFGATRFCIGDTVHFVDSSTFAMGTSYLAGSRLWTFDDGTTDTTANPRKKYSTLGLKTVKLSISNTTGCVSEITKQVRILPLPQANFNFPKLNFPGVSIEFRDSTVVDFQNIIAWSWNFGDPASGTFNESSLQNPEHTFSQTTIYTVTLTTTSNLGCQSTISKQIELLRNCPETNLTIASSAFAVNTVVPVQNTSLGASSYNWDFCAGDLGLPPFVETQTLAIRPSTINIAPLYEKGKCYVFTTAPAETINPWQRVDYGSSFSNQPLLLPPLGNPDNLMNQPICVKIFRHGNKLQGLAISAANNSLIRLAFDGDSVDGEISATPLAVTGLTKPENIEIVQDGDSLYAFIASNVINNTSLPSDNLLVRLSFGTSFLNTPTVKVISSPTLNTNGRAIYGISAIKECNRWYMAITAANGRVVRANFGVSLNNDPTFLNVTNNWFIGVPSINTGTNILVKVSLHREMGRIYGIAITASGNIIRLVFNTLAQNPVQIEALNNVAFPVNIRDLQMIKVGSEWQGFAIHQSIQGTKFITKLTFPNICGTSNPIQTVNQPQGVTYQQSGTYYVTLESSDARGWISAKLDTVTITGADLNPIDRTCLALNANSSNLGCANQPIEATATTLPYNEIAWDFCAGDLEQNMTFKSSASLPSQSVCTGFDIVKTDIGYFGFVSSILKTPAILSFGNSLNAGFSTSYINFPEQPLGYPSLIGATDIKAIAEDGKWYAFVPFYLNINTIPYIARLSFNSEITSNPSVSYLSGSGLLGRPECIALAEEEGHKMLFALNSLDRRLVAYDFGNSYMNTPKISDFLVDSTVSLRRIDFIKDCNRWYAVATDPSGNALIRMDFHKGLTQKPLFRKFPLAVGNRPMGIKLWTDNGEFYAITTSNESGTNPGMQLRIKFTGGVGMSGNSIELTEMGNSTNLVRSMLAFTIQKTPASLTKVIGVSYEEAPSLYSLEFPNNCNVNVPTATGNTVNDVIYTQNGTYNIAATVTDTNGNAFTVGKPIIIKSPVRPQFDSSGVFCAGQSISFINKSSFDNITPNSVVFTWNFGDPNSGTNNTATTNGLAPTAHTYSSTGEYEITLTATAAGNCQAIFKQKLRIFEKPVPNFTFPNPIIGLCANDSISMTNTSTAAPFDIIVATEWIVKNSAGDTVFQSTAANPKFRFTQQGVYTATLTIRGKAGCEESITKELNVVNQGAFVSIEASNNFCLGDVVQYTANITGDATKIEWFENEVPFSTEPNPTRIYTVAGQYNITLKVTNAVGCESVDKKSFGIVNKPTAEIAINSPACVGSHVFFKAQVLSEGAIINYRWNLGDGTPELNVQESDLPPHIYSTIGTYTVSLIVTSVYGCLDTTEVLVSVAASPIAAFNVRDTCVGKPVTFRNTSSANGISGGLTYFWKFKNAANTGDLYTSTDLNPTFTYTAAGTYEVILTVKAGECSNTTFSQVTIFGLPTARTAIDEGCIGTQFGFRDISTLPSSNDTIISRLWTITRQQPDNQIVQTSTATNPLIFFNTPGAYNVKLEIATLKGCNASVSTSTFTVGVKPQANFNITTTVFTFPPFTTNFSSISTGATTYLWDFGDGQTSTDRNPSHQYANEGIYKVKLTAFRSATNTLCIDTFSRMLSVFPQINRGVKLTSIAAIRNGNSIKVSAQIQNEGNVELTGLDISAQIGDGIMVKERWAGSLLAGNTLPYQFNSTILTKNDDYAPFVCVDAQILAPFTEITPENNRLCQVLDNSFQLISATPNPADQQLKISYLLTESNEVTLELIDMLGRRVISDNLGQQPAGVYSRELGILALPSAMYYVRLVVGKQTISQKIAIQHQ